VETNAVKQSLQRQAKFSEGIGNTNFMKTLTLIGSLIMASMATVSADWVAGRDLVANELPDGNGVEQINPNPTVPEWSYGFRGSLADTSLTLYTAAQHTNSDSGNTSVQGFVFPGTPQVFVNVGASDVILNFGFGNLNPLHPGEMDLHPGPDANDTFSIVRWIAPATGSYLIDAYWTDLDPNGTQFAGVNGASGSIVINGNVVFNSNFADNSGTSDTFTISLNAGDIVDFATGSQGDYRFDDTGFDASITAVPEPSTASSVVVGVALLGGSLYLRRRRALA
jgi:hypothetical protein